MSRYVCSICGFVYDEAQGYPSGGAIPGTSWEELDQDWTCPLCGTEKTEFKREGQAESGGTPETGGTPEPGPTSHHNLKMKELSLLECSALCTNFAKGCEKQYKQEEAALFLELAEWFKKAAPVADAPDYGRLLELIEKDLAAGFPDAGSAASGAGDRGALRALVWSEKVTRILKSLLGRHKKEGEALTEKTDVYVCTICGFIYVGDAPPEVCPVCKVPNWKFEKIEGRSSDV